MSGLPLQLPSETGDPPSGCWVQITPKPGSRAVDLFGTGSIWIEGSIDRAAAVMLHEYGIELGRRYCPCPSHSDDEFSVVDHDRLDAEGLRLATMKERNAITTRDRVGETQKPAHPSIYRNPYQRQSWIRANPYRTLIQYVFDTSTVRFLFASDASYQRLRNPSRSPNAVPF